MPVVDQQLIPSLIYADDLRMAVKEVLCDSEKERIQHEEALIAITVEESLKRCVPLLHFMMPYSFYISTEMWHMNIFFCTV